MKSSTWFTGIMGLSCTYLFILGWNVLAAGLSYMRRMQLHRFPPGRCLVAAAGPSLVPITLVVGLACWGYRGDDWFLPFMLLWGISYRGSAEVERRLPRSRTADADHGQVAQESSSSDPNPLLNSVQTCGLMILGAIKAWIALAIGVGAGYGLAAVVSWAIDIPFLPPSWTRPTTMGPIAVLCSFGVMGFLVEALKLQREAGDGPGLKRWSAARKLRLRLLGCLAGASVWIGLYAALLW